MATLERNGEHISYHVIGNGPPILLGHSLLCGPWMWDGVLPDLSHQFTVINVEFRGHGASSAKQSFTLDDLAADWLAIVDHLGYQKVALVGLSMGGMTALRLALQAPDRISALVLLDSSADSEPLKKRIEYKVLSELYARFGMNDLLAGRVMPLMLGKTTRRRRPDMAQALTERIRQHDRPSLQRCIQAVVARDDISSRLGEIRCPALIVCGDEDVATPMARSERMAERLRGSSLVKLPGVGHLSAMEEPARVAHEISSFLSKLS